MMDMLTMIVKRVKTLIILTLVESRLLGPSICSQTVSSVKNIWKSYIWTADKDVNKSDPRRNVHYYRPDLNHDLCDTDAALYQLS